MRKMAGFMERGMISHKDLKAAVPQLAGTLRLTGLDAPVEVFRDAYGIPHGRAI